MTSGGGFLHSLASRNPVKQPNPQGFSAHNTTWQEIIAQPQVDEWQSRPLDAIYPTVYLDSIVVKIRQDKRVINKDIYLASGVNMEGHKELLGMWLSENEAAKFWLNVLTELNNRGVKDILIACV